MLLEKASFIYTLQEQLFDVFDLVLENRRLPSKLGNLLIVIHYLQMISLLVNSSNPDLSSTLIQNYLFLGDYNLIFLALRKSPSLALSFFITILLTLLIFILLLGFFYIHYYKDPDDIFQKDLSNVLAFLYDLLDRIFLIPCFGVLILNLTCSSSACDSISSIILIIWSLILIFLIIFLEFLYVFCFFNFTFRIMDSFSRNPSQRPFLFFLIKILLIAFSVVLEFENNYLMLVLGHTIYGWFLFQETLTHYPYHDKNVSKCYGMFVSAYLWINGSLFFVNLVKVDFFHDNCLIIIFVGCAIFMKLFLTLRNYTVKGLMMSDLDEINSDIHLDLKVRLFNQLALTINVKKHELLLASLLKIHYDKCEDGECICRRRGDLYDPFLNIYGDQNLQFHKDDVFVKHYLIKLIKEGISKFSDSKLLYLDFIFYNFEALKIYAPIYCFIKYFQQKYNNNLHFSFEFCIHRLLAQLERFLIKKNLNAGLNERLMIENVKKFDKGISSLRAKLSQCVEDYTQIWNTLNQNMPDLGVLLKTCNHCIQKNNELLKLYEELVDLNDQSQKLKCFMEVYSLYISFDDLLWGRVEKEIQMPLHMEIGDSLHQDLDYLLNKYNMFDEDVGTVVISPNFENMGQILWVSANFPKLFHYDFNQFKTMNISNLMPEVIGKCHDKILQTFYLTSKEVAINNFRHLWAINKEGFCFSANLLVKVVPSKDDFEIMGLIHKLNDGDYILTNTEGELINLGQKISDVMEISPQTLSQTKINMQLLAPRLTQYYKTVFVNDNDLPDTNNIIVNSNMPKESPSAFIRSTTTKRRSGQEKEKKDDNKNNKIEDIYKQFRFYVFIPQDIENLMKLQQEEVQKSEAKFDLQRAKEKVFKDVKVLIQMRKCFGSSLKKTFSKIDLKKVKKVLRVKASLQHVKFSNGDINFVAIKILFMEIKKPDLISFEKRQKQTRYIKLFLKDMKKIEDNVIILNSNQKALEDQENKEETNENDATLKKEPTANDRIRNMLNLFRKKGPAKAENLNSSLTPQMKKEVPRLEKEASMTRQLSNLPHAQNVNPESQLKTSKKKFLEDQHQPPSPAESRSKKHIPMKSTLKNMLMKIKKDQTELVPGKESEEKKALGAPNKPMNMLKKPPLSDHKSSAESESNHPGEKQRNPNQKSALEGEKKNAPSFSNFPNNVEPGSNAEYKKKQSSINSIQDKDFQKKISLTSMSSIKKNIPFANQPPGKNPLSILGKIQEKLKNKEKEDGSDLESSSPEKGLPQKAWSNKFRNILLKKGIFDKKGNPAPAAPSKAVKKPGISFGGAFGGAFGGGGGILKGLLTRQANKKQGNDDSGTSRSVRSELLAEEEATSNSDERSAELNVLLKSENSTNKKEIQNRDLKEKLEKLWGLEEQEQVVSIASSAFSTVAQNSLKKIKENLKKQKTGLRLKISNILAFVCCVVLSSLTLSQYLYTSSGLNTLFKTLQEVNSISFYNENFLNIYNYYEVRRMISLGYYDWGADWDNLEQASVLKALDIMSNTSNEDIVQDMANPLEQGQQNNYVFLTYMLTMKIEGTPQQLKMNFLDFFRMYIVAINATLGLNTSKDFVNASIASNDYLSFIFDNFNIIEQIIDSNNLFIHHLLIENNDALKMRFIYIWIATFVVLVVSFAIVFPIAYQSRSKIFNTLALFTKIPLRDVEYYNTHYKQVMLNLGRIEEASELLKTVQGLTEQNQKDLLTLKRTEANSFIRTRNYKGINIDKFSYVGKVVFLFCLIYGLILAKDLKLFIYLWQQDQYQALFMKQHYLMSDTYRNLIHYKAEYSRALVQTSYQRSWTLLDVDPGKLVTKFLEEYSELSSNPAQFYEDMITMNLCQFLESSVKNCSYFPQDYCQKKNVEVDLMTTFAFDEIWGSCSEDGMEEGVVNFMLGVNNYLKNQFSVLDPFLKIQDSNARNQKILTSFQDNFELNAFEDLNHLLIILRKWYFFAYEALLSEGNAQLELNQKLSILFIVAIWVMMILGWWREYNKLKSDSKWVNGFIILLPMHLIKENQHLKVFLKKKIKISNLDN